MARKFCLSRGNVVVDISFSRIYCCNYRHVDDQLPGDQSGICESIDQFENRITNSFLVCILLQQKRFPVQTKYDYCYKEFAFQNAIKYKNFKLARIGCDSRRGWLKEVKEEK